MQFMGGWWNWGKSELAGRVLAAAAGVAAATVQMHRAWVNYADFG